jgi:hypothetical protein
MVFGFPENLFDFEGGREMSGIRNFCSGRDYANMILRGPRKFLICGEKEK